MNLPELGNKVLRLATHLPFLSRRKTAFSLRVLLTMAVVMAVFALRYASIDPDLYEFRDDGVITMSVGRNLVDFGFPGVNPSGPIVEASSSSLQTASYAMAYWAFGAGYQAYAQWQTSLCTALIGLGLGLFLGRRIAWGLRLGLSAGTALYLSLCQPFFLWHASGMENALTHVTLLGTALLLWHSYRRGRWVYGLLPLALLASMSRIDAVLPVAAMLVVFGFAWWQRYRDHRAAALGTCFLLGWAALQVWRWWIFGDLLPNTAYAQDISVGHRLTRLLTLDAGYLAQSSALAVSILGRNGGWLLLPMLPLAVLLPLRRDDRVLLALAAAVIGCVLLHPFIFGMARIDVARTTSQLALFVALPAVLLMQRLVEAAGSRFGAIAASALLLMGGLTAEPPYYLGWSTRPFNEVRERLLSLALEHDMRRPTTANPDLGVMTWNKSFNVVDLGMLGTPEMARLKSPAAVQRFFMDVVAPDLIEAHGFWVAKHCASIFGTEAFGRRYMAVPGYPEASEACGGRLRGNPPMMYFVRRDVMKGSDSPERILLDDLQSTLDPARVSDEIQRCTAGAEGCTYVARTVYKFIPELRRQGQFDAVLALFEDPVDRALLEGWRVPDAHRVIMSAVFR